MITNKHNLPQHLVDEIKADKRKPVDKRYSVTELLNSTKEIILRRRYHDRIVSDVADHIDRLFGRAFHALMEHDENDEQRLEYTLPNGVTISGRIDRIENYEITDYKTTKMNTVAKGDFSDWEAQNRIYAWLARKNGMFADVARNVAFIKDFSKMNRREITSAIFEHQYKITSDDILSVERWLIEKTNELEKYKNAHIDDLPEPLPHELWYTGDEYAVIKEGASRALKVFKDEKEAEIFATLKGAQVEVRKGENFKLIYDDTLSYLFNMKEEK